MGGLDLLIAGAASAPSLVRARQLGIVGECQSTRCLLQPAWWGCLGGIAANYFMHGFIWNYPSLFSKLCKKQPLKTLGDHPVDVFAGLEVVAKIVQGGSIYLFLGEQGRSAAKSAITSAPWWCWGALGSLIAAGQALNFATYAAIGNAGVYYGFKLGREVPWCYGFPFNSGLRHPQYLGVVLTLLGALPMFLCKELASMGLPQAVLAWCGMYGVMSAMEQIGDNDDQDKKK
eukprot:TRINITY_DN4303_c0_g4_i1.p1 TRINITY_DN4303_c0_g4~~TRINITY_DN4303_c0_g4_i1.p1  ORF type:complete len:231 (-),score=33.38 TRINITY_DN4303_c0_g4_i1:181-873(-)